MSRTSTGMEARSTTLGKWLLAAVVIGSAQALGSIPTEVLLAVSALAAVACGLLWIDPPTRLNSATRWILAGAAFLFIVTVAQAVPLPDAVCRAIAPANADIWDRVLAPLKEPPPAWHPISIAPAATHVEVLRGAFYVCTFLGALRVAALEDGDKFLLRLVVFASALMAFVALAHSAVSAERVFGVYRPRELYAYRPGRLAPLLNLNHLSAYLDIGACVAVTALVARRTMPRGLSGSAAVVLVAVSVWQGSRGAVAALVVGLLLAVALTTYIRRNAGGRSVEGALVAVAVLAAAIMVAISLSEVAHERLASRELIKFQVAATSAKLAMTSPWIGYGRGAFETIFPSANAGTASLTFTNPENIVAQWIVEWGLPVSIGGFGILAWALRPQTVLRAARPAIGAWVAVLVTVLHDWVDFHLEVPGVVALVAVCAAVVTGGRATSRDSMRGAHPSSSARDRAHHARAADSPREIEAGLVAARRARWVAFALSLATFGAMAWVAPDVRHMLAEDRRMLSAMSVDPKLSRDAFRIAVRAAMLRYPAEGFFPLMGAVREQVVDGGSPVPWVARALEQNPKFGRAHFVLARSLAATGRTAQARLEYRLAYENDDRLRDQIAKEAIRLVEDSDSALEMVPPGEAGVDLLDAIVVAIESRMPSTALILDREIAARSPLAQGPLKRSAEAALSDAASDAAWCPKRQCVDEALKTAESLAAKDPSKCELHLLVARLRITKGEVQQALDAFETAIDGVLDRGSCSKELVMLSFDSGQPRRAELILDKLVRSGCGAAADCVDLYGWAGEMEEKRGHYMRAVKLYRRVIDLQPDREDLLVHIGDLGQHDGVLSDAVDAYTTLAQRHPEDPSWNAKIDQLRARVHPPPGTVRVDRDN